VRRLEPAAIVTAALLSQAFGHGLVAQAVLVAQALRPAQTDTTATLIDIEQQLTKLIIAGDRAGYSAFLADDWSVINTDGNIVTKEQVLREMFVTGERQIDAITIDDVKVRPLGDVAVVTGRTIASGKLRGATVTATLRFTDVFARRDGRWQIVASQGTRVP
jgi:ketosteroid isomerase-like protein